MKVEVRCCCDARLFGFAEIPDEDVKLGKVLRVVSSKTVYKFRICLLDFEVQDENGRPVVSKHLAIKSQDYPASIIARLPGFQSI